MEEPAGFSAGAAERPLAGAVVAGGAGFTCAWRAVAERKAIPRRRSERVTDMSYDVARKTPLYLAEQVSNANRATACGWLRGPSNCSDVK